MEAASEGLRGSGGGPGRAEWRWEGSEPRACAGRPREAYAASNVTLCALKKGHSVTAVKYPRSGFLVPRALFSGVTIDSLVWK